MRPPPSRSITQATAYSKMLPDCGRVVANRHVEKHLVCLETAGALTTLQHVSVDKSPSYICAVI
jgi:hypothetical protein